MAFQGSFQDYLAATGPAAPAPAAAPKKRGFRATDLIPTVTGIAGGALGTLAGPLGTIAGGSGGAALGEYLRQRLEKEDTNAGKIATEAAFGAIPGGGSIAKAGGKVAARELAGTVALKSLKPSPSQITKFGKQTGMDLAEFLTKEKLVGKGAQEIGEASNRLGQEYLDIVRNQGITANPRDLSAAFRARVAELADSPVPADQALAQRLRDLGVQQVSRLKGAGNTLESLAADKSSFGKQVNFQQLAANPNDYTLNSEAFDILRGATNQAAAKAGRGDIADIGKRLQGTKLLEDIASRQSNLGRGANPLSLSTLLGAGAGAGVGGAAGGLAGGAGGALASAAVTAAVNNPRVLSALSQVLQRAGTGSAPTLSAALLQGGVPTAKAVSGQAASQLASRALAGRFESPVPEEQGQVSGVSTAAPDPYVQQPYVQQPDAAAAVPQQELIQRLLLADLVQTGGKNLSKIQAIQSILESQNPKPKAMTADQVKAQKQARTALSAIDRIDQALSQDPNVLVSGKLNPFNQSGRLLDSDIRSAIDVLGYKRTGATLTPEQAKTYRSLFPSALDSAETRTEKLRRLRAEFEDMLNQPGASPELSALGL